MSPRGRGARRGEDSIATISRVLRFLILIIPFTILSYWGGVYLGAVFQTLEAPGVPVRFAYVAQGGEIVVAADSYTLDLRRGYLQATRLRLAGPEGRPIARADILEVTGLKPLQLADQIIRVRASGVSGTVTRLVGGRFDIEQIFPPRKGNVGAVPFQVDVERARVELVDKLGAHPWRQTFVSDRVRVAGYGDDWLAAGTVIAPAIGQFPVSVENDPGRGLHVRTVAHGQELAPTLAHFITAPPLRSPYWDGFQARSVRLFGPVAIFIPRVGPGTRLPVQIDSAGAPIAAVARGVRYHQTDIAAATFRGFATTGGVKGVVDADGAGARIHFAGAFDWRRPLRLAGRVTADAPSTVRLPAWVRRQVDPRISFTRGHFEGYVAYSSPQAYAAEGEMVAGQAAFDSDRATGVSARLFVDPSQLAAEHISARALGRPASGAIWVDRRTRAMKGDVTADQVDLALLGRRLGFSGWTGTTHIEAAIGGSVTRPEADLTAAGHGRYVRPKVALEGDFKVSGRYAGAKLAVQRAIVQGPFGLLAGSGTLDVPTARGGASAMAFDVIGRDLDPSFFDRRLSGEVNLQARIGGDLGRPEVAGYAEGYEISFDKEILPAAEAHFHLDSDRLTLAEVQATQGTAQLSGAGSLRFDDGGLAGAFAVKSLQVADFLPGNVFGSFDIDEGVLGGTLSRPRVTASVAGANVFAGGIELDALQAKVALDGVDVKVDDMTALIPSIVDAKGGQGRLGGHLSYNLDSRQGVADVSAAGIPLADVTPQLPEKMSLSGSAGGSAHMEFDSNGVTSVTAKGVGKNVAVNTATFGSGEWNVSLAGGKAKGSAIFAAGASQFSATDLVYDVDTRLLAGHVDWKGARIPDLVAIEEGLAPDQSADLIADLDGLAGNLSVSGSFANLPATPSFDLTSIQGSDLQFRSVPLGSLDAALSLDGDRWTLGHASVSGGSITGTASGTVDTHGSTHLAGRIVHTKLSEIGQILPIFADETGEANAIFMVSGPTNGPEIQSSVDMDGLLLKQGESPEQALRASLVLDADGTAKTLTVSGDYYYRGFQGKLDGQVPYAFPATLPPDGAIVGSLTVARRSLKEIAALAEGIDPEVTVGTIGGKIEIGGTVRHPTLSKGLDLQADKIGFELPPPIPKAALATAPGTAPAGGAAPAVGAATGPAASRPPLRAAELPATRIVPGLRNVKAKLSLDQGQVRFTMEADGTMGGHVSANLATTDTGTTRLSTAVADRDGAELLRCGIGGDLTLSNFGGRQPFGGGTYISGVATGKVAVGGTMGGPALSGTLNLAKVDSAIPTISPSEGETKRYPVDPLFDLNFNLTQPARLRNLTADLTVSGGASLTGRFSEPSVHGTLYVDKGTIRLPAAVLRLDPDGTITPSYQPALGGALMDLDVDMVGHTALTALRYADVYQRYDITIGIRGDLLREGGLNLSATSDPGDLSQDRILGLLGESDVLATQSGSGESQADTERRIRDALTSFAIPSLAEPITSRLAQQIGLDYLTVEYNTYELATAVFAKSLGAGFSVQGRRQIGDPPPGFRSVYDLRLVYTLRHAKGLLNQLSLSFGADQLVPWKFDVNYGFRF